MADSVVAWQVISSEPDRTSRFLTAAFGWQENRDNALGYRMLLAGAEGIHGGVWPAPAGVQPFVQLFVQVDDIEACIAKARDLGATVIVPASVLPEGNAMAVLRDPSGLPIAIRTRAGD